MKINDLKDKNIAIWGLGVEGKAVLKALNSRFPDKKIKIIDDKNCPANNGVDACIINQLKGVDVVIRSPGVSIYKEEIVFAKKNFKTKFITEKTLFFAELEGESVKTIAITGTKGKTTTSTFCAELLKKMDYRVLLAGNMGKPTIELIDSAKNSDYVVIEISSYQASDLLSFPTAAILLNLFPEHIDWHKTHENYYADKVNLINGSYYKIVNGLDERVLEYTKSIDDRILFGTKSSIHYRDGYFYDGDLKLFSSNNMQLLGEHNYQNLCSVFTVLKTLNIDLNKIKQQYLDDFKPVEHRLETIKHNGLLFINDSISTIPEATIACYNIFQDKKIYGILGGFDRNQDYGELVKYIVQHKNIGFLALMGQTAEKLKKLLLEHSFNNFVVCTTMEECIAELKKRIDDINSSVLILSPAAASYDGYKNFEERGKDFKRLIEG